jgi:hypothetical protein
MLVVPVNKKHHVGMCGNLNNVKNILKNKL